MRKKMILKSSEMACHTDYLRLGKKAKSAPTCNYLQYEHSDLLSPYLSESNYVNDKFETGKILGQGSYAMVKVGYDRITGRSKALKIVSLRGCGRSTI